MRILQIELLKTDKTMKTLMKNILFLLFISLDIFAQSFTGGFNFNLPAQDTIARKFLPQFPVQPITDFISINNEGNFSTGGNRIRFWGANIVADGAFPDKNKSWFIAGRLRKMGFNLIRLHHIDNGWGSGSLLEYGKDTRHLNLTMLDKLEYLISKLKENGIFINMNLNVSRAFSKLDGIPDADSLVEFAKCVTLFDPYLISLEKEYAHQLLTHVNPYTGLALVDDPAMAMVETVNENSLYSFWRGGKLKPFAQGGGLTLRHTTMLDTMWNSFLKSKYQSTAALAQVWNEGTVSSRENNLVVNGDFEAININTNWSLELHNGAVGSTTKDITSPFAGTSCGKVLITNATGTNWHIQFKQVGRTIKKDSIYTLEFAGRSDSNRTMHFAITRDNDPYTYYKGIDEQLTTQWQTFSFSLVSPEDNFGYTRITFQIPAKGTYWFDDVKMNQAGVDGLLSGESLENASVKRIDFAECGKFSNNRVKDISAFYIKLQDDFFAEMKDYLKNSLGVKVPVVGTNWNFSPGDLTSQTKMDYVDNHSYWDHPSFPTVPWSSTDWLINNTPMVTSGYGTIPDLFATTPFAGKPYTISEYNHAFPNRYQSEAPVFLSSYASFHNTDGIMFFDYNSSYDWESDKVNSYFSIHRNTAMMSLMPSAAFAFRSNLISSSKHPLAIHYTNDEILLLPKKDGGGWQSYAFFDKKLALTRAIRTETYNSGSSFDFSTLPQVGVNPYKTDTEEITWNTNGLLTVYTPKYIAATGLLNNFSNSEIGNLKIISANGFGSITWLSLQQDSLPKAQTSLLTISTMLQNSGMLWDGTKTLHNQWGNSPTQMRPLVLTFQLKIFADSISVTPLDVTGLELTNQKKIYSPVTPNTFLISIDQSQQKSVWFGIEKYGEGVLSSINGEEKHAKHFSLEQNYPNPFNPITTMEYTIGKDDVPVQLVIYDVLGNEVAKLVDETKSAGKYRALFDGSKLSSGLYFAKLTTGEFSDAKKILLLK